jgi:two-component system OmpR family response regulator
MKPRILIVEDERHIGVAIKFNCEAEGYDAVLVGDGPSAVRLFRENTAAFDLIILDLMLPDMSGYAVLESLRRMGVQIPVLILSARTLPEDRIRGFDLGADQYLTKPFDLSELLARVRALLARFSQVRNSGAASPAGVYSFNSATIDFARHEVTIRGRPVALTALEFKLLRCFVENEGLVLTRAELLDRVWGFDATPTTRTVDNFIVRLRQHFEEDPAAPRHFLSVRGVGYRFLKNPPAASPGSSTEADDPVSADTDSAVDH